MNEQEAKIKELLESKDLQNCTIGVGMYSQLPDDARDRLIDFCTDAVRRIEWETLSIVDKMKIGLGNRPSPLALSAPYMIMTGVAGMEKMREMLKKENERWTK